MEGSLLTLKELIAITVADIDIFLLKEEDQETDKLKVYTPKEIRAQLTATASKLGDVLTQKGYNINAPLKADSFI